MTPGEWTGLLVGIGTVLVGVATVLHAEFQHRRADAAERVRRTTHLHELHYSEGFFSRVAMPVFTIARAWDLLPDDERRDYRDAVLLGWVGYNSEPALDAMRREPIDLRDPAAVHFRPKFEGAALSEHEALTISLYFWTRISLLEQLGMLDREVAAALFAWPYSYVSPFFNSLAQAIEDRRGEDENPPQWISAIEVLDRWLLPARKESPTWKSPARS